MVSRFCGWWVISPPTLAAVLCNRIWIFPPPHHVLLSCAAVGTLFSDFVWRSSHAPIVIWIAQWGILDTFLNSFNLVSSNIRDIALCVLWKCFGQKWLNVMTGKIAEGFFVPNTLSVHGVWVSLSGGLDGRAFVLPVGRCSRKLLHLIQGHRRDDCSQISQSSWIQLSQPFLSFMTNSVHVFTNS